MLRKMIPVALACSLAAAGPLWADSAEEAGFAYRQTVTFRGYAGASTLSDFPVLVKLPKRCFHTFSYRDVLFQDAAGQALACEVDSTTDTEVLFWVKLPALAGQTTTVTAWFGRAQPFPSGLPASDVWTAYAGVWHFNLDAPDSTVHALAYDKTDNLAVLSDNGLLGRGFKYESTDWGQGVVAQSPASYLSDPSKFSISGWFKPESSPPTRAMRLLAWKADHLRGGLDTFQNVNGRFYIRGNTTNYQTTYSLDWELREWSHLAVRVDSADFGAFLNGQTLVDGETTGDPSPATFDDTANVGWIGFGNMGWLEDGSKAGDFAYPFTGGEVDELRVFNGLMTEEWAAAEYATVANHATFTAYGELEKLDVDIVDHDGVWVSAALNASWLDAVNWLDEQPLSGTASTVTFRSPASVAEQTVALGDMVGLAGITQEDAVRRTVTDGRFAFADAADVMVAAGELNLADGLVAISLDKKGAGGLVLNGESSLFGVSVQSGTLTYRNTPAAVQDATFEVTETTYVTHLGVAEGASATAKVNLSLVTHVEATEESEAYDTHTLVAQTRFIEEVPGLAKDGYRYLRLPQPISLRPGAYEVVSDDASPARAILSTLRPEQRVRGTLDVAEGTALNLDAPSLTVQQLTGAGTVAAGTDAAQLVVAVPKDEEDRYDGAATVGPLALRKEGDGTLRLAGTGMFKDGVYVKKGTLLLATPDVFDAQTPVYFNDFSGGNAAGVLSVEGEEVSLSNPFYVLRMSTVGMSSAGVRALPGQTLTIADTSVTTSDADVPGRQTGEFALHAFADAYGHDPRVVFRSNTVDYVDFVARVDGLPESLETRPNNEIVLDTVMPRTKLRKLVVQNNTRNSLGGTVTITGGNELCTDYLDFTGAQLKAKLTGGTTLVAPNVRIADSSPSWEQIDESNVDLTVEEGSKLVAKGFPAAGSYGNTRNCTNSVLRLDGGTFQVIGLTDETDILPSWAAGQPSVELTEKGGTIEMTPYESADGFVQNVQVTSPIRSAPGVEQAPLYIHGAERLPNFVVNGNMSYAGPTTVDAATLALRKRLLPGSDINLAGGSKIYFAPMDATVRLQTYGTLAAVDGQQTALVNTASGELQFLAYKDVAVTKKGEGTLSVALGMTEAPVMENASVTVESGTFRIGGVVSGSAELSLVADGGFEPDPALPDGQDRNKNDKRGARDASYLASALPSWSFANINGAGICSRASYFSEASQYADEPDDNKHAAYLFNRDGAGWVSRGFDVQSNGEIWELEFRVTSSCYNNVRHFCQVNVMLDGAVVDTFPETPVKAQTWQTRHLVLGALSAGRHSLVFQVSENSVLSENGEVRVLLDNVKMGFCKVDTGSHVRGLAVNLQAGTKLNLDFDGQIEGAGVTYDGAGVYGHINAQNHPDFVTGRGTLYVKGGGCYIYFR